MRQVAGRQKEWQNAPVHRGYSVCALAVGACVGHRATPAEHPPRWLGWVASDGVRSDHPPYGLGWVASGDERSERVRGREAESKGGLGSAGEEAGRVGHS